MKSSQSLAYMLIPSRFGEMALLYQTHPFALKKVFLPRAGKDELKSD
jgi:hypothetical protein